MPSHLQYVGFFLWVSHVHPECDIMFDVQHGSWKENHTSLELDLVIIFLLSMASSPRRLFNVIHIVQQVACIMLHYVACNSHILVLVCIEKIPCRGPISVATVNDQHFWKFEIA